MVYIGISKFSFATRQCSVRCSSGIRVQSTSTDDHGKVTFTKLVNTVVDILSVLLILI